jgi:hypothetical protein
MLDHRKLLTTGSSGDEARAAEIDKLVALLPELYSAVSRVLDESAPHLSRRVGLALWALRNSTREDDVGKYLTTSDLTMTLRKWSVVSEESAGSAVSKLKAELFDHQYIKIEGGRDHIHLSGNGIDAVRKMIARAKRATEATVGVLKPEEQSVLLDLSKRMMKETDSGAR